MLVGGSRTSNLGYPVDAKDSRSTQKRSDKLGNARYDSRAKYTHFDPLMRSLVVFQTNFTSWHRVNLDPSASLCGHHGFLSWCQILGVFSKQFKYMYIPQKHKHKLHKPRHKYQYLLCIDNPMHTRLRFARQLSSVWRPKQTRPITRLSLKNVNEDWTSMYSM